MKIKLLTARASVTGSQNRGEEIDVPEAEAVRMIEAGQAAPVRAAKPEKAIYRKRTERAAQ